MPERKTDPKTGWFNADKAHWMITCHSAMVLPTGAVKSGTPHTES